MIKLKDKLQELKILFNALPTWVAVLFVMSVFSMNLLANKSISLPFDWLALDCGIIVSWFAFLAMDMITKHFGPKAATQISVIAILFNLLFCLLFFLASLISGTWGESYVEGCEDVINAALDKTFGGSWYVVAGSTLAFLVSAAVNNFTNAAIGRLFSKNPDGAPAFFCRTYVSTAIGQFTDNLVFAVVVSHTFFGWSLVMCVTCALTGMLFELLCEGIFSAIGFKTCLKWRADGIGREYFEFMKGSSK